MGVYKVECISCAKFFQWFSGTTVALCPECSSQANISNGNSKNNEFESNEINCFKKIIKLQDEMIEMLKVEIDRLKITTNQSSLIKTNPFISIHPLPGDPSPYGPTCGDFEPIASGGITSSGVIDNSKVK